MEGLPWPPEANPAMKKFKGPIRLQVCKILSLYWIKETVQIEAKIVRPNFHVKISEQFTIRECIRQSLAPVNMDLQEDVDEDDYPGKEVSCSMTNSSPDQAKARRNWPIMVAKQYCPNLNSSIIITINNNSNDSEIDNSACQAMLSSFAKA